MFLSLPLHGRGRHEINQFTPHPQCSNLPPQPAAPDPLQLCQPTANQAWPCLVHFQFWDNRQWGCVQNGMTLELSRGNFSKSKPLQRHPGRLLPVLPSQVICVPPACKRPFSCTLLSFPAWASVWCGEEAVSSSLYSVHWFFSPFHTSLSFLLQEPKCTHHSATTWRIREVLFS